MIFQLLRQFFRDPEFEQTATELAEARRVLSEFKEIVREQNRKVEEEKDKPDIEFITLLWASIGFTTAIGGNAIEKIPNDVNLISTPQEVIWLIIVLTMVIFVISNTIFAVDLTRKYASYRQDKRYFMYSQELSTVIIVYLIGAVLLALLPGLP
jgi:hypothetical protein